MCSRSDIRQFAAGLSVQTRMKSNILLLASAACGTALLWGGCSVTRNTIEPVGVAAQRQVLSDKRLVIDTGLRNRLQPIGIN